MEQPKPPTFQANLQWPVCSYCKTVQPGLVEAGENQELAKVVSYLRSCCEYQGCGDKELAWRLGRPGPVCDPCSLANDLEAGIHRTPREGKNEV